LLWQYIPIIVIADDINQVSSNTQQSETNSASFHLQQCHQKPNNQQKEEEEEAIVIEESIIQEDDTTTNPQIIKEEEDTNKPHDITLSQSINNNDKKVTIHEFVDYLKRICSSCWVKSHKWLKRIKKEYTWKGVTYGVIIALLNVVVVLAVNIGYVYSTSVNSLTSHERIMLIIAISLFKILWTYLILLGMVSWLLSSTQSLSQPEKR